MSGSRTNSWVLLAAIGGAVCFIVLVFLMEVFGIGTTPAFLLGLLVAVALLWWLFTRMGGSMGMPLKGVSGIPGAAGTASGAVHSDAGSKRTAEPADTTVGTAAPTAVGAAPAGSADTERAAHGAGATTGDATPPEVRGKGAEGAPAGVTDPAIDPAAETSETGPSGNEASIAAEAKGAPAGDATEGTPPPEAPRVKPSKLLAGETELGDRKGTWRYEREAPASGAPSEPVEAGGVGAVVGDAPTGVEGGAPDPTPTDAADVASAPAPPPTDADASVAASPIGTEPARLDGPRDGGPDDLKRIKGVGPKLEEMLHRMGFYHYDQIAGWTEREAAWVDENLEGFKGRVERDDWISQARVLSEGGETDFSRRADDGEVY